MDDGERKGRKSVREIIFRAKTVKDGRWVHGAFHEHIKHEPYPIGSPGLKAEDYEYFIIEDESADWGLPRGMRAIKVDPDTVGQFIGIRDMDGYRIWEGDIVSFTRVDALGWTRQRIGVVQYYDKLPIFYIKAIAGDSWDWYECDNIRVVGNKWDNRDLLEEEHGKN